MSYHDGPLYKITSVCKGGGYVYCRTEPLHPKRNSKGLYPLHRVLVENKLGRPLRSNEVVHHKDENPMNNRVSNLEAQTRSDHSRHHAHRVELVEVECWVCGESFELKPHQLRLRRKRSADGRIQCSRSCGRRAVVLRET